MTAPPWADAEWSPFGVALEPVIEPEPVIEFGTAKDVSDVVLDELREVLANDHAPALDDTGAPVIEWEPATREQLADGDTVRVTQVGRWKGTRLTGKTTHYERKTVA